MKTLKQILLDMGASNKTLSYLDAYQIAFKEWLTQKRQEITNNAYTFSIQKSSRQSLIDELLEELKK